MTYPAPMHDFYDDGLVHSHDWSRSTPPGEHHKDAVAGLKMREHDESRSHDHR